MNFEIKPIDLGGAAQIHSDATILVFSSSYPAGDDVLSKHLARALKDGQLDVKPGKLLALFRPEGTSCQRVILVGAGEGSAKEVKQAVVAAWNALKTGHAPIKKLVLCLAGLATGGAVRAAITAVADATYVYTATKSKPEGRTLEQLIVCLPQARELAPEFKHATAVVAGIELAKEWANRPANHATPSHLAQAARKLSKETGIDCQVLGPKEVAKLGMGSFSAVAQGSDQALRFIVLSYQGASKTHAPTVLVGKGITFDTGGISLKPAAEMDEMKFDMCGAASVLGVFRALGELRPKINVVGLIPACENMPDGRSVKPGDVVTSMSGQTIEVLNTDAEGRLILCDALTYAERFKPRAVVDIATLTGACVIALGSVRSGMFASNDALAQELLAAGESAQDLCWRMPLDDDYAEALKSNFADVANVGGRPAGAVTAAKFLQRFADKYPWAHLDIAGTAWKSGAAKGATGRPVGLLLDFLLAQKPLPVAKAQTAKNRKA
jgi:leucyl aminopeptidase